MKCSHCKRLSSKGERFINYVTNTSKITGKKLRYFHCLECNAERHKKYRETKSGKTSINKAARKWDRKHPEARKAWGKVQKLPKKPCKICGNSDSVKHHPDYNKPLKVIYLCQKHHKAEHRRLKKLAI
jgi:hypothetical protein